MPAALPTGTVTFLFTDIEGSTSLLEEIGADRYGALLADHHRVCRDVWAEHGGSEVGTAGDAFFVAFATASEALSAAAAAQAAVEPLGLRVRMGIHTGETTLGETGYVGLEVHRSARIAAAAHGGQILVSATAATLLGARGCELRDLGEHRFKDLGPAERILQLGDADFPPIRSLHRSNLPVPDSAFLGRRQEVDEIARLLSRPGPHLLTLTGPGGTGKTRLALQAAAEVSDAFPDGVWWLPLAPLADASAVPQALAQVLSAAGDPDRDAVDALADRLAGKRALVVLDNAEHLLPDLAHVLTSLRAAAPSISLLLTSRERLQLRGENVWLVPALAEAEGVELFLACARALGAAVSGSAAVHELCARLDNLPLALELAAARTIVFSPEQLLARLGQRLDILRGGRDADPRQQTLRATIDWSYRVLAEDERMAFRALGVFPDGCSLEGAEAVAGADPDVLQSLLDKSFLRRAESTSGPRFVMLETIREYALECLAEAGEAGHRWELFDRFMATWITALGEAYATDADAAVDSFADEQAAIWLAVERARASPGALAQIVVDLCLFWSDRGDFVATRPLLDAVAERLDELSPELRARVLVAAAVLVGNSGENDEALELVRHGIALLEGGNDDVWLGRALTSLAATLANLTVPKPCDEAVELLQRALSHARAAGDTLCASIALVNYSGLAQRGGDAVAAERLVLEASAAARRVRNSSLNRYVLGRQAELARLRGDLDGCARIVREILTARGIGWRTPQPTLVAGMLDELIEIAIERGELEEAAVLVGASETFIDEAGLGTALREQLHLRTAAITALAVDGVLAEALAAGRAMSSSELLDFVCGESQPRVAP